MRPGPGRAACSSSGREPARQRGACSAVILDPRLGWLALLVIVIGLAQLFYVVPFWLIARANGWRNFAKGLWIAAAIVALLNGACFAMVFAGQRRIGG